ncbi:MAG: alginate export family protein [Candidatus Omnitrophica bacterium]|nr:alginate export family protein [Candidatus Omnitrophota bacterium]
MRKNVLTALVCVFLMTVPALASVQNVKVGGDIKTSSYIYNGFDLGTGTNATNNHAQNVVLSQLNLNVDADLTDKVSTNIGLKNERLWGTNDTASESNTLSVESAYVKMKEMFFEPLTLIVGRQPLIYGNKMIIAKSGTNRIAALKGVTGDVNFDAIKAILKYDPLTVDLFASRVTENKLVSDGPDTNVNLYGINANYKFDDKMKTVVEAYTFVKTTGAGGNAQSGNTKNDVIYVPGLRISANPTNALNVQLEGAYQAGTLGNNTSLNTKNRLSAYAFQGVVNYNLPVLKKISPVVSAGMSYFSGDNEPQATDAKSKDWQLIYGNLFNGTIFKTLFTPQKNLAIAQLGIEVKPLKDLKANLTWYNVNLAQRVSTMALNRSDYMTAGPTFDVNGKKSLGNEIDLDLTYAYTQDVKFKTTAGYFAPGKGLSPVAQDSAIELVSSVCVTF